MITLETEIKDTNILSVNNYIDNINESSNSFNVNNVLSKQFKFSANENYSNEINVFDLFQTTAESTSFFHIQIKDTDDVNTINDARFLIKIDDNILGYFSQFSLFNCNDIQFTELTIMEITNTAECILNVIVGEK